MYPASTKILVIDDSSTMRKILKNILREIGFENVEEAGDGDIGLSMLQQAQKAGKSIEVIISDLNMPKMLGTELLKICKQDPQLKMIPFIISSIEGEQPQIAQAIIDGASAYLVKPYQASDLKEKLEKVFNQIK